MVNGNALTVDVFPGLPGHALYARSCPGAERPDGQVHAGISARPPGRHVFVRKVRFFWCTVVVLPPGVGQDRIRRPVVLRADDTITHAEEPKWSNLSRMLFVEFLCSPRLWRRPASRLR